MNEYEEAKHNFFKKHGGLKEVTTSDMKNDTYCKIYEANDGHFLHEVNRPVWKVAEVEGVRVDVKLFCTEWWSTDNSKSQFHYEKY